MSTARPKWLVVPGPEMQLKPWRMCLTPANRKDAFLIRKQALREFEALLEKRVVAPENIENIRVTLLTWGEFENPKPKGRQPKLTVGLYREMKPLAGTSRKKLAALCRVSRAYLIKFEMKHRQEIS